MFTCLAVIFLALIVDDALYSTDISVYLLFHTAGIKVVRGTCIAKTKAWLGGMSGRQEEKDQDWMGQTVVSRYCLQIQCKGSKRSLSC